MPGDIFERAADWWNAPAKFGTPGRRAWLCLAELPLELERTRWDELEGEHRFRLLSALQAGSGFGMGCDLIRGKSGASR
jgi:hypothetical protein